MISQFQKPPNKSTKHLNLHHVNNHQNQSTVRKDTTPIIKKTPAKHLIITSLYPRQDKWIVLPYCSLSLFLSPIFNKTRRETKQKHNIIIKTTKKKTPKKNPIQSNSIFQTLKPSISCLGSCNSDLHYPINRIHFDPVQKTMTRRCSHCSHNGHNSRTCPNRGVKLFGVRLTDGIRKSASMGNLSHYTGSGSGSLHTGLNNPGSPGETPDHAAVADGYASEDFVPGSSSASRERKKGTPWTEEEHRMFLLGLQKLGKGDWRGIARNYVISRTPTQVASHAQKYFIRQSNVSRRKRRSSLFDIVADDAPDASMVPQDFMSANPPQTETEGNNPLPAAPPLDEECESMDSTNSNDGESASAPLMPDSNAQASSYPLVYPAYYSPFFPFPLPYWSGYSPEPAPKKETHEVVKPTPVHSKSPINVDELVGMSKLSLGETIGDAGPSTLSRKLLEEGPSRQSAFHTTPACGTVL